MRNSVKIKPATYRNDKSPFIVASELSADYRRELEAVHQNPARKKNPALPLALIQAAKDAGWDIYTFSSAVGIEASKLSFLCRQRGISFARDKEHPDYKSPNIDVINFKREKVRTAAFSIFEEKGQKPSISDLVRSGIPFYTARKYMPEDNEFHTRKQKEEHVQPLTYSVLESFGDDLKEASQPKPTLQEKQVSPASCESLNHLERIAAQMYGRDLVAGAVRGKNGELVVDKIEESDGLLSTYVEAWRTKLPQTEDLVMRFVGDDTMMSALNSCHIAFKATQNA